MNKREYERKQQKIRRQKRFQNTERAALRVKTPHKTALKHKRQVEDDWDDFDDAPDGIQYRDDQSNTVMLSKV